MWKPRPPTPPMVSRRPTPTPRGLGASPDRAKASCCGFAMECELVMSARVLARMSVTRVYTPSGASSLLPGTNNMRSAGRLHFFFSPLPLPLPLPLKLLRHTCARARDAARRHVTRGATTTTTVTMTTIAISIAIVATGRNRSAARCSAVTRDGGGCGMAAAVGRGARAALRVVVAIA